MKADERYHKDKLVDACKEEMPSGVSFRHEDVFTSGIPDISYTWKRRTVWVEVKVEGGRTRKIQETTLERIGRVGLAALVVFSADSVRIRTFGAAPKQTALAEQDRFQPNEDPHVFVARVMKDMINCSR